MLPTTSIVADSVLVLVFTNGLTARCLYVTDTLIRLRSAFAWAHFDVDGCTAVSSVDPSGLRHVTTTWMFLISPPIFALTAATIAV